MIIYNVTVKIDLSVHEEWLNWMIKKHIPDVMHTGLFIENQICRVLDQDENDGITYAIQYKCKSREALEEYQRSFAPVLQEEHIMRYKNKFVAFRTILEVVS